MASGPPVNPALAGSFLLLGGVAGSMLAGLFERLCNLGKGGGVLAFPLAAELVSVRPLPVGALEGTWASMDFCFSISAEPA